MVLVIGACGYKFAGSSHFPSDINHLCITMLENRTAETGLENILTNDLVQEFTRRSNIVLTGRNKADALLAGVIKSMRTETISKKGIATSLARRLTLAVDLKLTDPAGKILWSAAGVAANEDYDVTANKLGTGQNRQTALSTLSKRLAENVYDRLTTGF